MENSQKNMYFIVGSIIVAALIIAGAVIYTNGSSSDTYKGGNRVATTNNTGSGGDQENTVKVDLTIRNGEYIRGNPNAKVTIIEFSDYECPFCQRFHTTVKQALIDYPDDVNWVYRHFPLDSIHPNARPAAEASECAGEQGKFWEFSDAMFEDQGSLGSNFYVQVATNNGLNMNQFNECVSSRKYQDKVESDLQEGLATGVNGTPGSFVNGRSIAGAVPYANLKAAIDDALAN